MVGLFLVALLLSPPLEPRAARAQTGNDLHRFRERALALSARDGGWSADELSALMALLVPDRDRFAADPGFRAASIDRLAAAWEPRASPGLRDLLLSEFGRSGVLDFNSFERLQVGWGAVSRASAKRRRPAPHRIGTFFSDAGGAIGASIFSLSSDFFSTSDAEKFLRAVRADNPDRALLVFVDAAMAEGLRPAARELNIRLLGTFSWRYTPWTRDSFTLLSGKGPNVTVLVRPEVALQRQRASDNAMGRELIKDLPEDLDRAWGRPSWMLSPVPFHNGQVLLTRDTAWVTVHSLEPRILSRLGLPRVPVETFATAPGVTRYVESAKAAGREMASFYGRSVKFVHPLPGARDSGAPALIESIGGGAGFDLDSLLTLIEGGSGGPHAIVADIAQARTILRDASPDDLSTLARTYGLAPASDLRERLDRAQDSSRARRLARFLDLCAGEMKHQGFAVSRIPLYLVPTSLLDDHRGMENEDFVLGWNNVVVESKGSDVYAEGFSGGFPAGDRRAVEVFRAAGCELKLVPPLVHSVVLNGGYRCASNHLRLAAAAR